MNKSLFVIACLIGLTLSVKINHFDGETAAASPEQTTAYNPSPEYILIKTDNCKHTQTS